MRPRDAIPSDWASALTKDRQIALGLDIGTTEKGTSNPSVLAVMQHAASKTFNVPLLVAWKTSQPEVTEDMVMWVLRDILDGGQRARRLCIDASSEVFFATNIKKLFGRNVPVDLVKGGEKRRYKGEEMDAKTLLGNLYCNAMDDGLIALPPGDWIKDDHRLVAREKGSFATATGAGGQHGDTFDACKLAYWGLVGGGGPASAAAAAVGELSRPVNRSPVFKGPAGARNTRKETLYA